MSKHYTEVLLVIGQRRCRYEGEYAPEVLDAVDGYSHDENPDWIYKRRDHRRANPEMESVEIFRFQIPMQHVVEGLAQIKEGGKATGTENG